MNCERCKKEAITSSIMSRFNTQIICPECTNEEKTHPIYHAACQIETWYCMQKDYNYKGVGLPIDLQQKYSCGPHKEV